MILRCTSKLLAVIGPNRVQGPASAPHDTDWYATLLWCQGRKCLLLTHAATLFSAVQADVTASDLRATHHLVHSLIERELVSEDLPPDTFGDLASETLHITKTADRSILGCMNDMAYHWQTATAHHGGLATADHPALNRSLRRNINSTRGYQRPIDMTTEHLARRS